MDVSPNAIAAALIVGETGTRLVAVVHRYTDRTGRCVVCTPTVLVLEDSEGGFPIAIVETGTVRLVNVHG